jgi:hypothetical protein
MAPPLRKTKTRKDGSRVQFAGTLAESWRQVEAGEMSLIR